MRYHVVLEYFLLCAKIKPRDGRIGVVANRVKKYPRISSALTVFEDIGNSVHYKLA